MNRAGSPSALLKFCVMHPGTKTLPIFTQGICSVADLLIKFSLCNVLSMLMLIQDSFVKNSIPFVPHGQS